MKSNYFYVVDFVKYISDSIWDEAITQRVGCMPCILES